MRVEQRAERLAQGAASAGSCAARRARLARATPPTEGSSPSRCAPGTPAAMRKRARLQVRADAWLGQAVRLDRRPPPSVDTTGQKRPNCSSGPLGSAFTALESYTYRTAQRGSASPERHVCGARAPLGGWRAQHACSLCRPGAKPRNTRSVGNTGLFARCNRRHPFIHPESNSPKRSCARCNLLSINVNCTLARGARSQPEEVGVSKATTLVTRGVGGGGPTLTGRLIGEYRRRNSQHECCEFLRQYPHHSSRTSRTPLRPRRSRATPTPTSRHWRSRREW